VAVAELHSAAKASQIKLSADRNRIVANGQDLSYITVELADNSGVRNPKAENQVSFEVDGPGTIEGVGNANPVSLESFIAPQRKAWHGRCMVIIKSNTKAGKIILKASSTGLSDASIEIESN
jgi:beta-galactosidase